MEIELSSNRLDSYGTDLPHIVEARRTVIETPGLKPDLPDARELFPQGRENIFSRLEVI